MSFLEKKFKNWTKPGPVPPGAQSDLPLPTVDESLDALSGYFRIFQLRKGHRFSTDDVLLAWYATSWAPCAGPVLDLGSGLGTVAMIIAWRWPRIRLVTVEAQPESVALAKKSATWNGLAERMEIREGDFRDSQLIKADEQFALVTGSPPYFPEGSGVLGDHPQKVACRFELRGTIQDYCETASAHLQDGGMFACVFPVKPDTQKSRVLEAARSAGLAIVRWRPVALREEEEPLLGLFAMMKAADLPPKQRTEAWQEPTLIIRRKDGSVHPEYAAIKLSFGFPP